MTSVIGRPRGERLLLAADAFLFAAALDIVLSASLIGLVWLLSAGDPGRMDDVLGPVWGSVLSLAGGVLVVFAGAIVAWRSHARTVRVATLAAMLFGVLTGTAAAIAFLVAATTMMLRVEAMVAGRPFPGPPWFAIGVLVALAVALVTVSVTAAARDLRGRRLQTRVDVLRLTAFAVVVLLAIVALPAAGSLIGGQAAEAGEAGLFMVPFATGAACAVLAADLLAGRVDRRTRPEQPARTS